LRHWLALSAIIITAAPAAAQMTAADKAHWAASAMAEADHYRERPCTHWPVDEAAVRKVVAWSGRSLAELRRSPSYASQRDAIILLARQFGADKTCDAGPALFDAATKPYGVFRQR
jgi:hypothetical protein